MIILLKKFGSTLTGRQFGKEAYLAIKPTLISMSKDELIEIDFEGVSTFTPSWGDEFITPLAKAHGLKLTLKNTRNPSVQASLKTLEEANNYKLKGIE